MLINYCSRIIYSIIHFQCPCGLLYLDYFFDIKLLLCIKQLASKHGGVCQFSSVFCSKANAIIQIIYSKACSRFVFGRLTRRTRLPRVNTNCENLTGYRGYGRYRDLSLSALFWDITRHRQGAIKG